MEITIEGTRILEEGFEVSAKFTLGDQSIIKSNCFKDATKAQVEEWLQSEAERILQTMTTVDELRNPDTEKTYIYEPGMSIMRTSAYNNQNPGGGL